MAIVDIVLLILLALFLSGSFFVVGAMLHTIAYVLVFLLVVVLIVRMFSGMTFRH